MTGVYRCEICKYEYTNYILEGENFIFFISPKIINFYLINLYITYFSPLTGLDIHLNLITDYVYLCY